MATDIYVVLYFSRTCDDHGVYVTKDSSEIIEMSWVLLAKNEGADLEELAVGSSLVRPVNTPLTQACTNLTGITWDQLRDQNAGTLADALHSLDSCIQQHAISQKKSFAFVVYNSFELRVELIREARDKMLQLPVYLQHPRYFDLKTEFKTVFGMNQNHSRNFHESLSLANICASLNITVDSSTATTKSITTGTENYASQTAFSNVITNVGIKPNNNTVPRRAYEEVDLLAKATKVLYQYAKANGTKESSTTTSITTANKTAFLRPCDLSVDHNALIAEKSKVVFLSNLPHDVIQSELESWFTQYGARPIALWTLKTPEHHHHRSSHIGFVVFGSHQEAVHCLNTMNGRALNDTAVEVAPSSGNVLEKAQEILSPFPTSKNRPRPGDWTCVSCRFSNFQRRTSCFRCNYPNIYANNGSSTGSGAGVNPSSGGMMDSHRMIQQQQQMYHDAHHSMNNGHYQHTGGANMMNNGAVTGSATGQNVNINVVNMGGGRNHTGGNNNGVSVPFRAGDWKCGNENCNYHNFAKNLTCLRCGASRVTAAVVGGAELYRNNNTNTSNTNSNNGNNHSHNHNHNHNNNGNNGYRRMGNGVGGPPQPQGNGGHMNHVNMPMGGNPMGYSNTNANANANANSVNTAVNAGNVSLAGYQPQNAYHNQPPPTNQNQNQRHAIGVQEPYIYGNIYNTTTTVPMVPGIPSMNHFTNQANGFN